MGDRAIIGFKKSKDSMPVFLYAHWGGSERYIDAARAIEAAENRWDDTTYATRIAVSTIVGSQWSNETGFGLSADLDEMTMPDYDDVLIVSWLDRVVEVYNYGELRHNRLSRPLVTLTFEHVCSMMPTTYR